MKKTLLVLTALLGLAGCADNKVIQGVEVKSYGVFEDPVPCIKYDLAWGNLIWSAILVETIIAPVYFIGFSIYEPVGTIPGCTPQIAL